MNIANTVLIEIGKGEGLQMVEASLPQLPVDPHLHNGCHRAGDIVHHGSKNDGKQIADHKGSDGIKHTFSNKMIQRIALKQR